MWNDAEIDIELKDPDDRLCVPLVGEPHVLTAEHPDDGVPLSEYMADPVE